MDRRKFAAISALAGLGFIIGCGDGEGGVGAECTTTLSVVKD